jgi:cysteine desulfuration protein SufE
VQTLTRALVSILCRGLNGAAISQVAELPDEFVPLVVGTELMRLRGRSIYHVMGRLRQAASQIPHLQERIANV